MRSISMAWSFAALTGLAGVGCTPFLGPIPDAGADAALERSSPDLVESNAPASVDVASERASDALPIDEALSDSEVERQDNFGGVDAVDMQLPLDATVPDVASDRQTAHDALVGTTLPRSGLVIQLEADYGLVTNSNSVSKWRDESGNGFDAAESDPDYQPGFIDDINAGFGGVFFGFVPGQDLSLPDGFSDLQAGTSLFFVVYLMEETGIAVLLQTAPDGPTLSLSSDKSMDLVNIGYHVGAGTTASGHAYSFDYGSWHLVEVVQQGGTSGTSAAFSAYLDGTALVTASQPVPSTAVKTAQLGLTLEDATMLLQAVLIYSKPVSNDERKEIEQYLMSKWKISP